MIKLKESRFLLAGVWNTLFGYFSSLIIYNYYHNLLHILLIGVMVNILNISMSFFTYKYFVFKTKKKLGSRVFEILCYIWWSSIGKFVYTMVCCRLPKTAFLDCSSVDYVAWSSYIIYRPR